ncbi:MAG: GyrI-like domain-containing protein [Bacteroidota bacterium]
MKMIKKIGIALLIIIGLVVVVSLFLPSQRVVERSISINAPTEIVFEQINTLKNWVNWSPWYKMDTAVVQTYFGGEKGKNAGYTWDSKNSDVGKGKLTIVESAPYDSIVTALDFMDQGTAFGGFKFKKEGEATVVTWYMNCEMGMNPIGKIFGLFMDGMLGPDFEKGLADIKKVSESMPKTTESSVKVEVVDVATQAAYTIKASVKMNEIANKIGEIYGKIIGLLQKNKVEMVGPPFLITHKYTPEALEIEAGLPVAKLGKSSGEINAMEIKSCKTATAIHLGSYESTPATYQAIEEWIKQNNKQIIGSPWEVYITDPGVEKDTAKWQTQIYFPIAE